MDHITNIVDTGEIDNLRTNQGDTSRPTPAKRGELWFDPWLNPKGEALAMLVEEVVYQFTIAELPRRRARSVKADASLKRIIEAVVCNLALAVLKRAEAGLGVVVPMGSGGKKKQSRYHRTGIPKKALPKVIRTLTLVQPPILVLQTGSKGQSTSTITATDWFVTRIEDGAISEAGFGRHKGEEVIILAKTAREFGYNRKGQWGPRKSRSWKDYEDTETTHSYREEVRRLNGFLEGADIGFLKDGLEPVVFSQDRTLRRYFSIGPYGRQGAFERNGRLYGGFWLNLKRERRVHIRMDGERVCLLDFSSMFVRLAYAQVGVEPPEGDLYDLTGFLRGYDNEQHRDGVKQGFNSLLNGGKAGHRDILNELPKGTSARGFREAVAKKHPALSRLFTGQPVGLSLYVHREPHPTKDPEHVNGAERGGAWATRRLVGRSLQECCCRGRYEGGRAGGLWS